jgi:hypothetical protein
MSSFHLMVTFALMLIILLFSGSIEKFIAVGSKKYKAKKLKESHKIRKKLQKEHNKNCKDLTNVNKNITNMINDRAYCRFVDTGLIANQNNIKSWSS